MVKRWRRRAFYAVLVSIAAALIANAAVLGALYLYWQHNPEAAAPPAVAGSGDVSAPATPTGKAVVPLDSVAPPPSRLAAHTSPP